MNDSSSIFQANRNSTGRLSEVVKRISEDQLQEVLPNGWSIAVTLGHLAFWDYRVIRVIELAQQNHQVDSPDLDIQLNEILLPFLQAIPPARMAAMAVEMASRLDDLLDRCDRTLIDEMDAVNHRWVDRSLHRNDHLKDIEAVSNRHS